MSNGLAEYKEIFNAMVKVWFPDMLTVLVPENMPRNAGNFRIVSQQDGVTRLFVMTYR